MWRYSRMKDLDIIYDSEYYCVLSYFDNGECGTLYWCQKSEETIPQAMFILPLSITTGSGVTTGCAVVYRGGASSAATKGWSASSDQGWFPYTIHQACHRTSPMATGQFFL